MKLITGQFSDAFLPIMDGVVNVVKNYADWEHRTYGSSYVITPDFPDYEDKEPYSVIRYPSIPIPFRSPYRQGLPSLNPEFMKTIIQIPFNLVHTHSPFSAGRLGLYVARKKEIPVIASFHSKYYDDLYGALKVEALARIGVNRIVEFYESVDYVWTVNNGTADTLREYGYKGDIDIIPNGTDFSPVSNHEARRKEVNEKLHLQEHDTVFLYVGQLVWQKNLKTVFESLASLKSLEVPYKMLIVGRGYAQDEMKEMAISLGVQDDVLFLGSILDRDYLKSLYCRADLFLFPSVYDNASIAVREAAAVGCPSLLIDGSNTAEGVIDNYNGFLADNDDHSIASRIVLALSSKEKLKEVGMMAQKTIYVNWENVMEEVNQKYIEIAKRGIKRGKRVISLTSPKHFTAQKPTLRKKLGRRLKKAKEKIIKHLL